LFAAKEAAMKALGTGMTNGASFREIETTRDGRGQLVLKLYGNALQAAELQGFSQSYISIGHDRGMSVAVVIMA
jgi:holo-[acyl-carrier protein] synthase